MSAARSSPSPKITNRSSLGAGRPASRRCEPRSDAQHERKILDRFQPAGRADENERRRTGRRGRAPRRAPALRLSRSASARGRNRSGSTAFGITATFSARIARRESPPRPPPCSRRCTRRSAARGRRAAAARQPRNSSPALCRVTTSGAAQRRGRERRGDLGVEEVRVQEMRLKIPRDPPHARNGARRRKRPQATAAEGERAECASFTRGSRARPRPATGCRPRSRGPPSEDSGTD